MRKWLSIFLLGSFLVSPSHAWAQGRITLDTVQVQLWPEYDHPSMLVIYDFMVGKNTALPAQVTFHLPKDANVIAVAFEENGDLINAQSAPITREGDWQLLTITVDALTTYHFEYYQPLQFDGQTRKFLYLWNSGYAVQAFNINVREPVDTVSLAGDPALEKSREDGTAAYSGKPVSLAQGEQFKLKLQYEKSSDALTFPASQVQVPPINDSTSGRIPLNGYLPYIISGAGGVLVVGGLLYYFLSGRERTKRSRRRDHALPGTAISGGAVHCHQCGTRLKSGDRFCRVCGTRLRQDE